jgi:hypothetical protein
MTCNCYVIDYRKLGMGGSKQTLYQSKIITYSWQLKMTCYSLLLDGT